MHPQLPVDGPDDELVVVLVEHDRVVRFDAVNTMSEVGSLPMVVRSWSQKTG